MATIKQKKAFTRTLENNGNVSKSMLEAGYAPSVAKNPHLLTKSDGWQELVAKYMPDDVVAKKHKQLLNKTEKIVVGVGKGYSQIEDTGQPHSDVARALDMAYKLKGSYAAEKSVVVNVDVLTLKSEIEKQLNDFRTQA